MLMTKKAQIQSSESVTIRGQLIETKTEVSPVTVENKIIVLRDIQVILDRDIAELYGVETKVLNQAVKRNINRFPERFMFQLTKDECSRSQIVTLNTGRGYNVKYLPYAFTEQGVAMLSSVLRTDTAVEVSIKIIDAFVRMRHFLVANAQIFQRLDRLDRKQLENEQNFEKVFAKFEENEPVRQGIFFDSQTYDAYTFVADRIREAKSRIILIDNYVDDTVLTILDKRDTGVAATIYTMQISKSFQLDIDKHNTQYPTIEVKVFRDSHDRFLIIDSSVYHFGASIKDLGKKWFAVTLMTEYTADELLQKINSTNPGKSKLFV